MCTILLLHVDDMIITGDDNVEITRLQDALSLRFEMKSLGEASCFLGLRLNDQIDLLSLKRNMQKVYLIAFI